MARPEPTYVYHFTHIDHLPSIVGSAIWCDSAMQTNGLLKTEAGDQGIKLARRERAVDVPPGGVVGDYVPFYYTPLSPMLYKISCGGVSTYPHGVDPLVFLVSTPEELQAAGRPIVISDGNARTMVTEFRSGFADLDTLVDWEVIRAKWWMNTIDDGDRKRRRAAELLVHEYVQWEAVTGLATRAEATLKQVQDILTQSGAPQPVELHPEWYY